MGFEDFRVVLSGRDKNFVEIFEWLLAEAGAVEVLGVNGASRFIRYCTISDGPHIFELELEWIGRSAIRLSCRFALCHPRSVDAAFVALLESLVHGLNLSVQIVDESPMNLPNEFSPAEIGHLRNSLAPAIEDKRCLWIADAGPETATLTCRDAIARFLSRANSAPTQQAGPEPPAPGDDGRVEGLLGAPLRTAARLRGWARFALRRRGRSMFGTLLSAGDCPACGPMGDLVFVCDRVTVELFFFCPGCGVASHTDEHSDFLTPRELAPNGMRNATREEIIAGCLENSIAREIRDAVWNDRLSDELVRGFVRGLIPAAELERIGLKVSTTTAGHQVDVPASVGDTIVTMVDLLDGFRALASDPEHLRVWASIVLGICDVTGLDDAINDPVLGALWDASNGAVPDPTVLEEAQSRYSATRRSER